MQSGQNGLPQNTVQENDNSPVQLEIQATSSGASFFVLGVKGNDEIKKKLKEMGGKHNGHVRGWVFPSRKLADVCEALGLENNVDLVDPRKIITVHFVQKLQWPGEMSVAEAKMKELGMAKKTGKGNEFTGDLTQALAFLKAFNIGLE